MTTPWKIRDSRLPANISSCSLFVQIVRTWKEKPYGIISQGTTLLLCRLGQQCMRWESWREEAALAGECEQALHMNLPRGCWWWWESRPRPYSRDGARGWVLNKLINYILLPEWSEYIISASKAVHNSFSLILSSIPVHFGLFWSFRYRT